MEEISVSVLFQLRNQPLSGVLHPNLLKANDIRLNFLKLLNQIAETSTIILGEERDSEKIKGQNGKRVFVNHGWD